MQRKYKKITEKMSTKFDKLNTRIETIDRKADAAESLAKQNQIKSVTLQVSQQLFKKN